jgi:hypothetical protein
MPTLDEWEQALVTPQRVIVESSQSLIAEVQTLQHVADAKKQEAGKPASLRKPNLTTVATFSPSRDILLTPAYLLQRVGWVTTPAVENLADICSYWAYIRYLWAFKTPVNPGDKLRLSDVARSIDFHQKSLMSDQIGVGMAAVLMGDYLEAPIATDVDIALKNPVWQMTKDDDAAPDYLFFDESRTKLFVVECKGTQTTRSASLRQLRRGTEQVPTLKFKKRPRPPSLVVATCLAKGGTRVLVLDPPGDDEDSGDDRRLARRLSSREWEILEDARFLETATLVSEAKALAFAGAHELAAAKIAQAEVASPRTPRATPQRQVVTENEFGQFRGSRQRVGFNDGVTIEVLQGLEESVFKAIAADDRPRTIEAIREFRPRMRRRTERGDVQPAIAVQRGGASLSVQVPGPEGSLLEIRVMAP